MYCFPYAMFPSHHNLLRSCSYLWFSILWLWSCWYAFPTCALWWSTLFLYLWLDTFHPYPMTYGYCNPNSFLFIFSLSSSSGSQLHPFYFFNLEGALCVCIYVDTYTLWMQSPEQNIRSSFTPCLIYNSERLCPFLPSFLSLFDVGVTSF